MRFMSRDWLAMQGFLQLFWLFVWCHCLVKTFIFLGKEAVSWVMRLKSTRRTNLTSEIHPSQKTHHTAEEPKDWYILYSHPSRASSLDQVSGPSQYGLIKPCCAFWAWLRQCDTRRARHWRRYAGNSGFKKLLHCCDVLIRILQSLPPVSSFLDISTKGSSGDFTNASVFCLAFQILL